MTINHAQDDLEPDDDTLPPDGGTDDGDDGDGDDPAAGPNDLRYPLFPKMRVADGAIARMSIERVNANGAPTTITEYANAVLTDQETIRAYCGGGRFVCRPRRANNQMLGSVTFEVSGTPKPLAAMGWPESLLVPFAPGIRAAEHRATTEDPQQQQQVAAAAAVSQHERDRLDWEARRDRDAKQWEQQLELSRQAHADKLQREREAHEARLAREAREHELTMKRLEHSLLSETTKGSREADVQLKRLELDYAKETKEMELKAKERSSASGDTTERLMKFGESLVERIVDKNPELVERVVSVAVGEKLNDNAKSAVKAAMKETGEAIGAEVADTAISAAMRKVDPRQALQVFGEAIIKDPDSAREFLRLLKDAANDPDFVK